MVTVTDASSRVGFVTHKYVPPGPVCSRACILALFVSSRGSTPANFSSSLKNARESGEWWR